MGVPAGDLDPVRLLGLLSGSDRLRVFAALVLGASSAEEVSRSAGRPVKVVLRALSQLERGGLAMRTDAGWAPLPGLLQRSVAAAAAQPPRDDLSGLPAQEASVLRSFMAGGRIGSMPAQWSKRRVLLAHIARIFEPGIRYPEREVDALLRAFYDDHATLRRYLVDEGFLSRDRGEYWRTGGVVDV